MYSSVAECCSWYWPNYSHVLESLPVLRRYDSDLSEACVFAQRSRMQAGSLTRRMHWLVHVLVTRAVDVRTQGTCTVVGATDQILRTVRVLPAARSPKWKGRQPQHQQEENLEGSLLCLAGSNWQGTLPDLADLTRGGELHAVP